jgi:hypothetical protein
MTYMSASSQTEDIGEVVVVRRAAQVHDYQTSDHNEDRDRDCNAIS